ncbi:hypothetical protein AAC03nite_39250 [Alicyclobacillus acidoterrestris]|nr:hypothetical protein AAC03nite_39250 [Alicyclobacillus acidoterrestris]
MKPTLKHAVFTGISLLFGASLIINVLQFKLNEDIRAAAYSYGFSIAFAGINKANEIFNGTLPNEDTSNAVLDISKSAGQFESISHVMEELGISHVQGIGVRLEEAAEIISEPNKYSKEQIYQNKHFVEEVASDFQPCFDGSHLIKNRLPSAIAKVYTQMSSQERSLLYSM